MTKTELLKLVNTIANKISDLENALDEAVFLAKAITRHIEDIPDDESEIEDSEVGDED